MSYRSVRKQIKLNDNMIAASFSKMSNVVQQYNALCAEIKKDYEVLQRKKRLSKCINWNKSVEI